MVLRTTASKKEPAWLGSSCVERDFGVLVDTKLSMGEQCAAPARKATENLGCTSTGITSRDSEVPLLVIPLCTCQATPGALHSVLVPAIPKRCGEAEKGPNWDDQRTGKPAI